MKRKITSKVIFLSMLLALIFSAVGTRPAQAYGPYTHNAVAKMAYDLLPESELKALLREYKGSVMAGSVFPDATMIFNGNYAEATHNPPFIAGYFQYIRNSYAPPYFTTEGKQTIAFLFGIISHEVDDPVFHYEYLPYAYDIDDLPDNMDSHHQVEMGLDAFNVWSLFAGDYSQDVDWSFLPTEAILSGTQGGMSQAELLSEWEAYSSLSTAQVFAEGVLFPSYHASLPNTYDSFYSHEPGGMTDSARRVADAWLATWDMLNYSYAYPFVNYVKPDGSDSADCQSWENACSLQRGLNHSVPGMQVWVAAGTYKPTTGTDRKATFQLNGDVAVYGGFPDVGDPVFTDHDPIAYPTILSGDLLGNDNNNVAVDEPTRADNSYHVVTGAGNGAILDGFTITGGNANGAPLNTMGGGWDSGGGMYNNHVDPLVRNVTFIGNSAFSTGGGMYNFQFSRPTVTNVAFIGNSAQNGGGMGNYYGSSDPTLMNVTFMDNHATENGGGLYGYYGVPTVTNVTFNNNSAGVSGGGMFVNNRTGSTLTNVTFRGNSAGWGGGLYSYSVVAEPTRVRNAIFWDNTAPTGGQIIRPYNNSVIVSDSVVQGGFEEGTNILTTDPMLGELGDYGGYTPTIPLLSGSSAIDAGNDAACAAANGTDQRGALRLKGPHCDMGAFESGILHVTATGSTTGNCPSWANACTLQYALSIASSGDEIWAEAGVYTPTVSATDRGVTFQLKKGVAIFGGFAGTETARDQRNPASNVTILSGDIGNDDTNTDGNTIAETAADIQGDNSYHVVTGITGATLDGFTVTGGYASGDGDYDSDSGGGMYNHRYSSPTITNVVFSGNRASFRGGGMYNDKFSNPALTNATFNGNSAIFGGGMDNEYNASPTLTNITFSGNTAQYGGGVDNSFDSNPTLTSVTFIGNSATYEGGGMINEYNSSPTVTNVTFNSNSAQIGGGMYNQSSSPQIRNAIFWNNTATYGGAQIENYNSAPVVSDSVVQSGYSGTNILTADPLLGTPGNYGGPSTGSGQATRTIPLLPGSSAIDAGNAGYCTIGRDQRGVGYVGTCDIGAFESKGFTLTKTSGDAQSATITTTFSAPMILTVAANDLVEPVNGGQVMFTSPGSGAGAALTGNPVTIAGGAVSITATANGMTGSYDVTAGTAGSTSIHFALTNTAPLPVLYAKPGGATSGACDTWVNACELRYALSSFVYGQEIWVAAGTYKPTASTTDRNATFQLKGGEAVYGGFPNTGAPLFTDRDPAIYVTILSGDIDNNDSQTPVITNLTTVTGNTTNSYHVVKGANNATLDGFTITAGYTTDNGGGMYNYQASPTVTNVVFNGNSATYGGGMYAYQSSAILANVVFSGNSATYGGGVRNYQGNPTFTNVTFSGNSATYGGGMDNEYFSSPTLTNVTFSGNPATQGGGLYNIIGSEPQIRNAIFWGNTATGSGAQIYMDNSGFITVDQSVVQGGYGGSITILTADPLLGALGNYGGFTPTIPLLPGSSAINTGNGSSCTAGSDQRGVAYVGACDIGAFESKGFTLTKTGGEGQNAAINTTFATPLSLTITANDPAEPVNGGQVMFTSPGSGAGALVAGSPVTIASGAVSATATANGTVGSYNFTASAAGAASVQFGLTNEAPFPVLYTKPGGATSGACDTWANACELRYALSNSLPGQELWVAAGTYKPTASTTDRNVTFQLKSGVVVYGGFPNTGTPLFTDRDPAIYVTILSGDIDNNDSQTPVITNIATVTGNATNSYHVVTGATGATLDGFTITAGYTTGNGGGMYNFLSSPAITNVVFSGNSAQQGGGMASYDSSPTLSNVTFSSNKASSNGAGMFNYYSNPTLTNVTFNGNSANSGGGMSNGHSSPTVTNATFSGNSAQASGGGMDNYSGSNPMLTNVTFSGNSASAGGGMLNFQSSPTLTNATFSGNSATSSGGGMYNQSGGPQIRNSILWGNTAAYGAQLYNYGSSPVVSDSVVQGGTSGANILSTDPLLGALGNHGGPSTGSGQAMQTIPLLPGSPAIDVGNDAVCPASDQRGVARPQGAHCDIGAMEMDPATYHTISGNVGVEAVSISYAQASTTSDSDGNYSFSVYDGWSGTVTPSKAGYAFSPFNTTYSNVTEDASGENYTAVITTEYTLTVTSAHGTVTKSPNQATYLYGDVVQLSITPEIGWNFANWSGGLSGSANPASITIHGNTSVTANYAFLASVRYARPAATGTGDCLSWANACTLQTALTGASNGDMVWVAEGTHKPTTSTTNRNATFQLTTGVSVYGGFPDTGDPSLADRDPATNLTILSGDIDSNDSQTPIITNLATVAGNTSNSYTVVKGANNAILDGFTITAGYITSNGGGMANSSSSPIITNATFSGNSGGGMYNTSDSNPTLTNVTFSANSGHGMSNFSNSNPTLTNVTFSGNSANTGGGMYNGSSSPILTNVTFSGNSASSGGGMYNYQSSPSLTNVTFSGNSATSSGGGMYNYQSNLTLTNVTFSSNSATSSGGGMFNSYSNPTLANVSFTSNTAGSVGGGMVNDHSNPAITDTAFINNIAIDGGGISNGYSSPTLTNVTFIGNQAANGGGMTITYRNSTGSFTLTNVTFSGNSASSYGGGIYNASNSSNLIITNVTFRGNSATYGGGIFAQDSTPQIRNTILWGNTATTGSQILYSGGIPAVSGSVVQGGYAGGTNIITADPLLDTLGNYGGFTQTIPLLPGSSAIDTGNDTLCTAAVGSPDYGAGGLDQRGMARPQGPHCDIGAYEVGIYTLTVTSDHGSVTKNPDKIDYYDGESVDLTVSPAAGWSFASWSGGLTGTAQPGSVTIHGNTAITANYQREYTLTVNSAHGAVTKSPNQASYHEGDVVTLSVTPETGWTFTDWTPFLIDNQITITGNTTVTANFTQNEYSLTVNSEHGTVTKNPSQITYHDGDVVQLTSLPHAGWSFTNWSDDGSGSGNPGSVTIHGNSTVTANYTQNEYTLTITSGHGTVTKSPNQATYHEGDVVQLSVADAAGWTFANWSGDGTGSDNPGSVTIHGNTSVTANYTQNEYILTINSDHGTVTKDPVQVTHHYGDVVELAAMPDTGWSFDHWSGDLTGSDTPGSVTILGNTSVTASYTQNEYTLTVASAHGAVTKSPDQATYHEGDEVQLSATADVDWTFANWSGAASGSDLPVPVTIHGNTSVTASYVQNEYTLTVASDHGTVTKSPNQATYHEGDVVQLSVTAAADWTFASWSGAASGSDTPVPVTIHGNTSVTASYTQNEYTLTVASAYGTVTKSPDQLTYHYGDVVKLTATPDTGWTFTNWTSDLTSPLNPHSVAIHGNTSVTANFAINTYTLTYTAGAHGSITGDSPQTVNHGAGGAEVTAVPNAGYHFVNWSDGVLTTSRTDTNVSGDINVTANFAEDNHAPTDISLSSSSVAENQPIGTTIGTLSTTDPDPGDTHTYSLACTTPGADDASFSNAGNALNTAAVFDYETKNSYAVCVRTDDGQGGTFDKHFTISVTDVNEAPSVALSNQTTSLPEDTDTGSAIKVADITVTDDALGTNVLSLSGSDASLFQIVGTQLRLKAGTVLDYETNPTLNVTVEVDDSATPGDPDDSDTLAISVTDVNEAPSVALSNQTNTLPEDTDTGSSIQVADTTVTDDALGTNITSLSGSDANLFQIVGTQLRLKAGTALDYETNPTLNVTVEVDDSTIPGYPDDSVSLAITVTYVDASAPTVVSITRVSSNLTSATSVDFTVTFSESVTGVDAGDFSLATMGVSGASVSGISGSGSVYTVTVSTGSNDGSIRLDVPVGASITDLAGNPLASLPYTGGETYIVTKGYKIYMPLILKH